jgi:hypothetical protein
LGLKAFLIGGLIGLFRKSGKSRFAFEDAE